MSSRRLDEPMGVAEAETHVHRLVLSRHVFAQVFGSGSVDRFNALIAVKSTSVLSSMWFFWFCVLLDLTELALGNPRSWTVVIWVTYLSQTVIQLLALPLLGAGQRIIAASQDARAEADHETLLAIHTLSKQQLQILRGQNEILDLLKDKVAT